MSVIPVLLTFLFVIGVPALVFGIAFINIEGWSPAKVVSVRVTGKAESRRLLRVILKYPLIPLCTVDLYEKHDGFCRLDDGIKVRAWVHKKIERRLEAVAIQEAMARE